MSHGASAWAIQQRPATAHQKLVLMILADYHNAETGLCFPSAATVADMAMCNERTVRRAVHDLQSQGYIRKTERKGRSPLIDFNWDRTPDTGSGVRKGDPREPVDSRPVEGPDSTPDRKSEGTADITMTPDSDDRNPGLSRPPPRTLTTGTPDRGSDEPGINRVLTRYELGGRTKSPSDPPSRPVLDTTNPPPDPPAKKLETTRKLIAQLETAGHPVPDALREQEAEFERECAA